MNGVQPTALEAWYAWRQRTAEARSFPHSLDPLPAHVGLWLDRGLVSPTPAKMDTDSNTSNENGHPDRDFLQRIAIDALDGNNSPAIRNYRPRFTNWAETAKNPPTNLLRKTVDVQTQTRLHLHPASQSSVTEGGLLLHHTYGVPYLPGSALKGLCHARAQRMARAGIAPPMKGLPDHWPLLLFGWAQDEPLIGEDAQAAAGIFDFWDALWIPPDEKGFPATSPLVRDVVNPHHKKYYGLDRNTPSPSDQPEPSFFLNIAPKVGFRIVVETLKTLDDKTDQLLTWLVKEVLIPGLIEDGIGARTRSGYGRIRSLEAEHQAAAESNDSPQVSVCYVNYHSPEKTLLITFPNGSSVTTNPEESKKLMTSLTYHTAEKLKKKREQRLKVFFRENNGVRIIERISEK